MGYCEGRGSWTIEKIFVPLEIVNFFGLAAIIEETLSRL